MTKYAKFLISIPFILALFAFALNANAQIQPAQNQVTIAPFGGLVTSTSTVGTRKLEQLIGNTYGQLTYWNGTKWDLIATSSLGLADNLTFNSPLSRTGNAVSFLFNTFNTWTNHNIFSTLFASNASTTNATTTGSQAFPFLSAGATAVNTDGKLYSWATTSLATFGYPFSSQSNYATSTAATTTPLWAQMGLFASSTSHFVNFDASTATITQATTSSLFSSVASTSLLYGANLSTCNGATNALIWSAGIFGCNSISGSVSPFTFALNYATVTAATSSPIWAQSGIFASSTSHFVNFDAGNTTTTNATTTESNFAQKFFNTSGTTGGYKIDTVLILQASSTRVTTFVGSGAGAANTTGSSNTAMGNLALNSNVAGLNNAAFGNSAMRFNNGGSSNTAIGYLAYSSAGSGSSNTGVGAQALNGAVMTGNNNTAVGANAGSSISSGTGNVLFGLNAADNITTGSGNVVLGSNIDAPSTTASNQLNVGNIIFSANIDGTGTTISSGNVGIATTTPWGLFSINPLIGNGAAPQFAVGSSTGTNFLITNSGGVAIGTSTPPVQNWFAVGSTTYTAISVNKVSGKVGIGCENSSAARWTFGCGSNTNVNPNINLLVQDPTDARFGASVADRFAGMKAPGTSVAAAGIFSFDYAAGTAMNINMQEFGANVGVASSTPWALLSINPNNIGNAPPFSIGSSTRTLFRVESDGDIVTGAPKAPTVGTCGTATISATSTDMRGTISVTAGTPTTCNLIFSSAKTDTPTCIANGPTASLGEVGTVAASTTGVQFGMLAVFSGNIQYICLQ